MKNALLFKKKIPSKKKSPSPLLPTPTGNPFPGPPLVPPPPFQFPLLSVPYPQFPSHPTFPIPPNFYHPLYLVPQSGPFPPPPPPLSSQSPHTPVHLTNFAPPSTPDQSQILNLPPSGPASITSAPNSFGQPSSSFPNPNLDQFPLPSHGPSPSFENPNFYHAPAPPPCLVPRVPQALSTTATTPPPQIPPLLQPSSSPEKAAARRPPPLSKEDPQRDLSLLPMVIDLVSEKPSTRWSYDALFHALFSEIYNHHPHTSTHLRPYRVKALIDGSRNAFVLFFNKKDHMTEFVKALPPTLTHPSSREKHKTRVSWPGHINAPVTTTPRHTLFANVPLRALVDSYNTSTQTGKRVGRTLTDAELLKVIQTVVLEPSKGAILEGRLTSADGGLVLHMADRNTYDTALRNGLSLQNISTHIYDLHPPSQRDHNDPFLCGYCAQYTPHEGLMFCPNPPRCLTCGEQGHAELRSSIRVKCPLNHKHPNHNANAINTCIHCEQTHRAGSRTCPVWAQAKAAHVKEKEAKRRAFTTPSKPPPTPPSPAPPSPWHKRAYEHILTEIRDIASKPCDRKHGDRELPASMQMENKLASIVRLIDLWSPKIGDPSGNTPPPQPNIFLLPWLLAK